MKNCEKCGKEFEPQYKTGAEQKYCSHSCRYKSANDRKIEKIKNLYSNENRQEENKNIGTMERQEDRFLRIQSNSNYDFYSLIEKLGEAKNESFRYQLKSEKLEEENTLLKQKIMNLEAELDEIDTDDNNDNNEGELGFIGKIPPPILDYILSMLKNNTNAQTTNATR
ncbi:MAG: hypothetical protein ACK52I_37295 [Pseudomonadota bacterium]|jgi:hypothetical protein